MKDKLIQLKILGADRINVNAQRMIRCRPDVLEEINQATKILTSASLKERLHFINAELIERPTCQICGGAVRFEERGIPRYNKTCSSDCTQKMILQTMGDTGIANRAQKRALSMSQEKYNAMYIKAHKTKIEKGLHLPDAKRSKFEKYRSACMRVTFKNDLTLLEHFERRGLCGVPGAYQIGSSFVYQRWIFTKHRTRNNRSQMQFENDSVEAQL